MTYHGPGQIVAYPLFDRRRLKIGVRELVRRIEQALIDTLDAWNIVAVRRAGAHGVYVGDAKIAALGLRIRRGCSFHGLAFNVAMDLEPFRRINPCGFRGLAMTQMIDLGGPGSLAAVEMAQVEGVLNDIRAHAVDMVTVGQYLRPTVHHHPVARYWTPDEFRAIAQCGNALGFRHVASGRLVRSSYHADQTAYAADRAEAV